MISITDKGDHYVTDRSADYHNSNHITIHKCAKLTCGTLSIAQCLVSNIFQLKKEKNSSMSSGMMYQSCAL